MRTALIVIGLGLFGLGFVAGCFYATNRIMTLKLHQPVSQGVLYVCT